MDSYAVYAISSGPSLPGGAVVASLSQWTWVPVFAMAVTFLLLLFPDGHLSSPRWRWFAWVTGIDLVVVISLGILLGPGQIEGSPGVENVFGVQGSEVLTGLRLVADRDPRVGRQLDPPAATRGGIERAQTKWLVTAAAIVAFLYTFVARR